MDNLKCIVWGIVGGLVATLIVYDAIDTEVARNQYNENVEECEPIDGCLFDWNCRKYNNMIEKACKK